MTSEEQIIAARREKLRLLKEKGWNYPNDFKPSHHIQDVRVEHIVDETFSEMNDSGVIVIKVYLPRYALDYLFPMVEDGKLFLADIIVWKEDKVLCVGLKDGQDFRCEKDLC